MGGDDGECNDLSNRECVNSCSMLRNTSTSCLIEDGNEECAALTAAVAWMFVPCWIRVKIVNTE